MTKTRLILIISGIILISVTVGIVVPNLAYSLKNKRNDVVTSASSTKALYAASEDTLLGAYGTLCLVPGEVISRLVTSNGKKMVQITCTDQSQPFQSSDKQVSELQKNGAKFNVDAKTAQDFAKFTCSDGSKVFYDYNYDNTGYNTYACSSGEATPAK